MRVRRFTWSYLWVVLVIASGLLAGCGKSQADLAAADSGGQVALKPGQTFTLTLDSNPTTGYSWEFVGLDSQNVVEVVKQEYKADSKLIGSGGVDTIRLKAVQVGEAVITLVYHRSWEKDVAPLETFTYTVTVQN